MNSDTQGNSMPPVSLLTRVLDYPPSTPQGDTRQQGLCVTWTTEAAITAALL